MDHLPIFKTAGKAFVDLFCILKQPAFYFLLAPIYLVDFFTLNVAESYLNGVQQVEGGFVSVEGGSFAWLLVLLVLSYVAYTYVMMRWYRHKIIGEPFLGQVKEMSQPFGRTLWANIKLTLLSLMLMVPILVVSILPPPEGVIMNTLLSFITFAAIYVAYLFLVPLIFVLPVATVGLPLSFKNVYALAKECRARLFISCMIVVVSMQLFYAILLTFLGTFTSKESVMIMQVFLSPFVVVALLNVVSYYFVFYIIPYLENETVVE